MLWSILNVGSVAVVAQWLEKRACDRKVVGSIPGTGRINLGGESEKAALAPPSLPPLRCP